jgi:hypothetical protein
VIGEVVSVSSSLRGLGRGSDSFGFGPAAGETESSERSRSWSQ